MIVHPEGTFRVKRPKTDHVFFVFRQICRAYATTIVNNQLINVSDTDEYATPPTDNPQGPTEPLFFTYGANNEYIVDQQEIRENTGETPLDDGEEPTDNATLTIYFPIQNLLKILSSRSSVVTSPTISPR